ncbi:LamG domain-containing protein [bacterium]|nr:LamG domain-containing protein [bacterium]
MSRWACLCLCALIVAQCAPEPNSTPELRFNIHSEATVPSIDSFGLDLVDAFRLNVSSVPVEPNTINAIDCVGLMVEYSKAPNVGRCELADGEKFSVIDYIGLNSFTPGSPTSMSMIASTAGFPIKARIVGFKKPSSAQNCVGLEYTFDYQDVEYSYPYILSSDQITIDDLNRGAVDVTANFSPAKAIHQCDDVVFPFQPMPLLLDKNANRHLTAYYPFNGNHNDVVGGNDLSKNSGTITFTANAKDKLASDMSATDYYYTGSTGDDTDIEATGELSISGWIYDLNPNTQNQYFYDRWNSNGLIVTFTESTIDLVRVCAGATPTCVNLSQQCRLEASKWIHYAFVLEKVGASSTRVIAYKNGTLCDSQNIDESPGSASDNKFSIGDGGDSVRAHIDEYSIWQRKLSAAEVQMLFNSGRSRPYPFYQLDSINPFGAFLQY